MSVCLDGDIALFISCMFFVLGNAKPCCLAEGLASVALSQCILLIHLHLAPTLLQISALKPLLSPSLSFETVPGLGAVLLNAA